MDNKRRKVKFRDNDGMVKGRNITNEMNKLDDMIKAGEVRDNNINDEEVIKLVRQYVKTYVPIKDKYGNLISNSQTVLQATKDDMINDRYKVLQ